MLEAGKGGGGEALMFFAAFCLRFLKSLVQDIVRMNLGRLFCIRFVQRDPVWRFMGPAEGALVVAAAAGHPANRRDVPGGGSAL